MILAIETVSVINKMVMMLNCLNCRIRFRIKFQCANVKLPQKWDGDCKIGINSRISENQELGVTALFHHPVVLKSLLYIIAKTT